MVTQSCIFPRIPRNVGKNCYLHGTPFFGHTVLSIYYCQHGVKCLPFQEQHVVYFERKLQLGIMYRLLNTFFFVLFFCTDMNLRKLQNEAPSTVPVRNGTFWGLFGALCSYPKCQLLILNWSQWMLIYLVLSCKYQEIVAHWHGCRVASYVTKAKSVRQKIIVSYSSNTARAC